MKRNLLFNSLVVTFGVIFAISAQDKTKKVEKNVQVVVKDGKVVMDTVIWTDVDSDMDYSFATDSTVNVFVIKKGDGKEEKIIKINAMHGTPGKEMKIKTIVDGDGDTSVVKTIILSNGFDHDLNFTVPPPPPPPLPKIKFRTQNYDPLEAVLNDPDYEILDYTKKEKNGVERIEIKRKKIEE
ncbi:hypothetical protein ACE01N_05625 [Saccharicrinis sp. FJH2]|uniref:hypothetical protein n=1 Tax=unclassified Saccharicrinis TaxID=2646859 RepID=UPI0035D3EB33